MFSLYLELDYAQCRAAMKDFFRGLPGSGTAKNSDKKIDGWWDEGRKPQGKDQNRQMLRLQLFFRRLAQRDPRAQVIWRRSWLDKPLSSLEDEGIDELRAAVRKFQQPYSFARFYRDYAVCTDLLSKTVKKYCGHFFYLYRIHSDGKLVRDVLHVRGRDQEKIFCNLFLYTDRVIESPKYPDWHNIQRYKGNVLFNQTSVYVICVSPDYDSEQGPEYVHIVFKRMLDRVDAMGSITALTDEDHAPASFAVYIQKLEESIPMNKMPDTVRIVDPETEERRAEVSRIRERLAGKSFVIR